MKVLKDFIKLKLKNMLLTLVYVLIFVVVYTLYDISMEPLLYGLLLTFVLKVIVFIIEFIQYRTKILELNNYSDELPKVTSMFEKEYQNIILNLENLNKDLVVNDDKKYNDMIEYYTMWVHQIKTPIQALRLITEDEDELEQVFRIEEYVEMVLQYLRLENMNNDLLFTEIDLDQLIKKTVKKYAKLFIKKRISLEYQEMNIKVVSDEKWLSFVIEQILSNSLKYTKKGSIKIYTEETNLIIQDTGIGINQQDLCRIFEKGYTGYTGRKSSRSSGIGLYLCKNILNRLSHTIEIQSKINEGTKVIINLKTSRVIE